MRWHLLENLQAGAKGTIRLSEEVDGAGSDLLRNVCALGLRGIFAKHRDSAYRSGRTGDWLKINAFRASVSRSSATSSRPWHAAASAVCCSRHGVRGLDHVGSVGAGFKAKDSAYLKATLDKLKTTKPVISVKRKNLVFAQPTLIAEIEFRDWTGDGILRHASYKGLRDVQDNAAVSILEVRLWRSGSENAVVARRVRSIDSAYHARAPGYHPSTGYTPQIALSCQPTGQCLEGGCRNEGKQPARGARIHNNFELRSLALPCDVDP